MKIQDSINLFLEHCKYEKNLSDNTLKFYHIDLCQLREFLIGLKISNASKIDKYSIKKFVQHLSKFKPKTVKRKIATSKAYLNFLEFEDIIIVNPYRKIKVRIKEPVHLPVILEFDEIKSLFQVIKKEGEKVKNKKSSTYGEKLRDLAVLELLFATGIRVSEACNLSLDKIDLNTGKILINGKGNKERIVQVCNHETLKILNSYYKFYENRIEKVGFFLLTA